MGEESDKTSKYNEAALQIARLDEYWRLSEQYASLGQFHKWNFWLDAIWRTLYADALRIKDTKKIDFIKKNREIKKEIKKYWNDNTKLYPRLNRRHEILRHLQDSAGKGGWYVEGEEEGL